MAAVQRARQLWRASGHLRQSRRFAVGTADPVRQKEQEIEQTLLAGLANPEYVKVTDTSGGCGSMYRIEVAAEEFRGKPLVKQHQLVTAVLKDHIQQWHGFVLDTKQPSS